MNKIDNKISKEDFKKTDYPDLEKLPDHSNLKHFVYVLLNKPRWFIENHKSGGHSSSMAKKPDSTCTNVYVHRRRRAF